MFNRIMVPVDLAHEEALSKALRCAGDLGKLYGADLTYVGVTGTAPGQLAHTPEEYDRRLKQFAAVQGELHGVSATSLMVISHDPVTDIDDRLLQAVRDTGADLVVMASHAPGLLDHVWPSNGGKLAEHAPCSVMVVRG